MKTNKVGMLEGYPLHDSELVSLVYQQGSLRLSFERELNTTYIDLEGVKKSCFKDFKLSAILSEIFAWRVVDVPENIVNLHDGAWRTLFCDSSSEDVFLNAVVSAIDEFSDGFLIQFNFSYGGSFVVISDKMVIS